MTPSPLVSFGSAPPLTSARGHILVSVAHGEHQRGKAARRMVGVLPVVDA